MAWPGIPVLRGVPRIRARASVTVRPSVSLPTPGRPGGRRRRPERQVAEARAAGGQQATAASVESRGRAARRAPTRPQARKGGAGTRASAAAEPLRVLTARLARASAVEA